MTDAATLLVKQTSNNLGATLPDSYLTALDDAEQLRSRAAALSDARPAAGIVEAMQTGKPWQSDKTLVAQVLDAAAARLGVADAARQAADTQTAIPLFADDIIASWNRALEADAATLTSAATQLDLDDLADGHTDTLARRRLAQLWGDARISVQRFTTALNGWMVLAHALHLPAPKQVAALALADLDTLELPTGPNMVWTVARAATQPLQLAAADVYADRVARHQAARAQAAQDDADARNEEFKKLTGLRFR